MRSETRVFRTRIKHWAVVSVEILAFWSLSLVFHSFSGKSINLGIEKKVPIPIFASNLDTEARDHVAVRAFVLLPVYPN